MKPNQLTKRIVTLALVLAVVLSLAVAVHADMGPKRSVRVYFENMGEELCYGTLLSERESTGPASAWDGVEEHAQHSGMEGYEYLVLDEELWQAFVDYKDADGYYFLQEGWNVSETKEMAWTYYPPDSFKLLLYYPETGTFAVSGVYERYAFDSYYTVDMAEVEDGLLTARRSYDYSGEILSLIVRIIATIAVEVLVALAFGFREKKQLLLVLWVNVVTQVILNVVLNVIAYKSGAWAFVFFYVIFELVVVVLGDEY